MVNVTEWADLWELTKNLLLLSHGQASVERGFSINKEISVENMTVQTLISQRVIKDHLLNVRGVTKVSLTKELLVSANHARQRYQAHLDEEKRKKEEQKRGEKRKDTLEELDNLKEVKKRMKDYNKVYVCLFTRASTRAVHLELTRGMNVQDFPLAFRKFASRRGLPATIQSDNAGWLLG